MTPTLIDINLLEDPWARAVPYEQFELLRRDAPVYWHEHPSAEGFRAVSRYDDVRAASRDHKTFSAELGSTFIVDQEPEALETIRMTILNMDPPKHSRCRRLVSAGFAPRMAGRLINNMQARASAVVANVEGRETIEFVDEVASELPLQMICEMIGVPYDDPHLIFDWCNRLVGFPDEEFRTSEEDGQIAGRSIKAGDKVVIFYASANRDPARFDLPNVFDPRRTPNEHRRMRSDFVNGIKYLPVRLNRVRA